MKEKKKPLRRKTPADYFPGWTASAPTGELVVSLPDFTQAASLFLTTANEIAGYAYLEDQTITNFLLVKEGIFGQVSGSVEFSLAKNEYLERYGLLPNVQWHTHPGMTAFHSGVDLDNMSRHVAFAAALTETGTCAFLVIDGLDWLCRVFSWRGETRTYADVPVRLGPDGPILSEPKLTTLSFLPTANLFETEAGYSTLPAGTELLAGDLIAVELPDLPDWDSYDLLEIIETRGRSIVCLTIDNRVITINPDDITQIWRFFHGSQIGLE